MVGRLTAGVWEMLTYTCSGWWFLASGSQGSVSAGLQAGDSVDVDLGQGIFEHGKWPLFFLLTGLILSFLLVRIHTRLIRKGYSWYFKDIKSGGTHVHHMVFGFVAMIISGIHGFAIQPGGWAARILAFVFGGATGIVLDEFALIFHLQDVYWEEQGRKSVDAVVVTAAFILILLIGLAPYGIGDPDVVASRWALVVTIVLNSLLVIITLLKGRVWLGVLGVFFGVFAWVAAFRLARPGSPWAHMRYKDSPEKLRRAQERADKHDRRLGRVKRRIFDVVAGKPGRPVPHMAQVTLDALMPDEPGPPPGETVPPDVAPPLCLDEVPPLFDGYTECGKPEDVES